MKIALIAPLALALTGCTTPQRSPYTPEGSTEARIGQQVDVGGPKVVVLSVLEDSRCPAEVDCVWAGRVKVQVRVVLGSGPQLYELTSDQPLQVADGQLELTGVMPPRSAKRAITPEDYVFALRFSGGL
jgi:hypothetical protein